MHLKFNQLYTFTTVYKCTKHENERGKLLQIRVVSLVFTILFKVLIKERMWDYTMNYPNLPL